MAEKCIELKGITKAFDVHIVLDHMNLDIHENEFVTLLGPSGCGKTTTLRIMGGFETADEGQVLLNGTDIARLPANKRPINTEGAIILGMIYNFLPFMVLPIYNSLIKIPQDTFDAAKDLGANWIQTLWRITLPQILPGIVSGITMVFVPAMTTFVISNLLGGAKINLIGNVIEQEFTTANNWYGGAGLSIVLMILILGSMAVMSHFDKEGEGAAIW